MNGERPPWSESLERAGHALEQVDRWGNLDEQARIRAIAAGVNLGQQQRQWQLLAIAHGIHALALEVGVIARAISARGI